MIGCYYATFGGTIHMVLIWPIHIAGVAISGLGFGIMTITHARYVQEYVPQHLVGICFAAAHLLAMCAQMFGLYSANWLPPDDDRLALQKTDGWLFVLGLPVGLALATTVMLLAFVRHETPAFYISRRQDMQALKVIRKIYSLPDFIHDKEAHYD